MSSEQTFYITIALLNLVLAFAATRVKDTGQIVRATPYLTFASFMFSVSWFLRTLPLDIPMGIAYATTSTLYFWGLTIFSFKRCEVKVPWWTINGLFIAYVTTQTFFILQQNTNNLLHTSAVFIPIASYICGYLLSKKKNIQTPSDTIVTYAYFAVSLMVITRSVLLEFHPSLFEMTRISTQLLWPIFSVTIGVFLILSFSEEAQLKLEKESITDTLTGLFNRRMFDEQLKLLLPTIARDQHYGALLYIDLDGFKPINDEYGHNIGDKVLIEFGEKISKLLRAEETLSRIGGDEFAILIKNAGKDELHANNNVKHLASRIQAVMQEKLHINGLVLTMKCSIGVHILAPDSGNSSSVIKLADSAMYEAKKKSNNSVVFSGQISATRYTLNKIGQKEIDEEHQQIDDLLSSIIEKKTEIKKAFPELIYLLTLHFKHESVISKEHDLNFSKEHFFEHKSLLDFLTNINQQNNDDVMLKKTIEFMELLEEHSKKHDLNLRK